MTTTLVWTGVALRLGLNAAIAARRPYVMRLANAAARPGRIICLHRHRA